MTKRSKQPEKQAKQAARPGKAKKPANGAGAKKIAAEAMAEPLRRETPARKATFVLPKAPTPPAQPKLPPAQPTSERFLSPAETLGQSVNAARRAAVAVNLKLIDMACANLSSGFDLAKRLTEAKTPLEAARLHLAFWDERLRAFADQAQELRSLSADAVAEANEPFRRQMRSGVLPKAA